MLEAETEKQSLPATPQDIDQFVDYFLSTMCDRSRRQIIEFLTLAVEPGLSGERRAGDIAKALKLAPATTSGHLRQLTDTGVLASRREGNIIYYRIRNHLLVEAFRDLVLALNKEHTARSAQA